MAGNLSQVKYKLIRLTFLLAFFGSTPLLSASELPVQINGITYIVPVNTPPLSNSDAFVVNEIADVCDERSVDTSNARCIYTFDALANDLDTDGDPLTLQSVSPANYGTVSIVSNALRYVPGKTFFEKGNEILTYEANDPFGGRAIGTVSITLNRAPLVKYDGFSIPIINPSDNLGYECNANNVDTSQCEFAVSPLANDPVDTDGDEIVRIMTYRSSLLEGYNDIYMPIPANGSDNISADGKHILYKPSDRCFYGTEEAGGCDYSIVGRGDSAYRVIDARGAISKIAFVAYSPDNTPPTAENDGVFEMNQNTSILIDVLANDSDEDGHTFTLSRIAVAPQNGSAVIENGQIRYTPATGYTGSDLFTYEIEDSLGAVGLADVNLSIVVPNTPPQASPDSYSLIANSSGQYDVLINDNDSDGHAFTLESITTPPTNGSAVISEGNIVYTPAVNFVGTDQLTYQIMDEIGATANGVVTFSVTNSAPLAVEDSVITQANAAITIDAITNDSDPDGHSIVISAIATQPTNGSAAISANQITYTPALNFSGSDAFTYTLTDEVGATSTGNVLVSVNNSAPVANNDSFNVLQNSSNNQLNVLLNDTDSDAHALTLQAITVAPVNGTAVIVNNQIQYTPDPEYTGSDSLTYRIADEIGETASAILQIQVDTDNTVPVANNDQANVNVGESVTIDVVQNDTDADNDQLMLSSITTPPSNGTASIVNNKIVYSPTLATDGNDSLTYSIADGKGGTASASLSITIKTLPTVQLIASSPTVFQADTMVAIEASADDTEDAIAAVRFRLQGQSSWTEYTNAPYIHNLGSLSAGSVVVELQAVDSSGALSAIVSETITIAPAIVINASWDNSPVSVGTTATLTWTASHATLCFSNDEAGITGTSGSVSIVKYSVGTHNLTVTCRHEENDFEKSIPVPLVTEKLSAPQGLSFQNN